MLGAIPARPTNFMALTNLKNEKSLIDDLERLVKKYAKLENADENRIRGIMVFLCQWKHAEVDEERLESQRQARYAIYGEGR